MGLEPTRLPAPVPLTTIAFATKRCSSSALLIVICLWSGLSLNHIEMLQLKSYTLFALKASTSLITSHINNTMRIVVKRVTHAISFKENRYIPTISDTQIVYNLLFQLRFPL